MSKKLPVLSVFAAIFALCLMVVSPAFAHHADDHAQGGGNEESQATTAEGNTQGSENTPGNDRKEGYEDNSTTPQDTNQGQGSDHDGDADSDPNTATEDDHTTADEGDNAHPSGKDRSVENGGSGNQGKSESNPDDSKGPMRYEGGQGDDKPNGPGGTDRDDQDGNNGCGNDDDFDDDNNGWCGKPKSTTPPQPCDADANMPGIQKCETVETCPNGSTMPANGKCDEVQGEVITHPSGPCDKDNNMANGIQSCNEIKGSVIAQPTLPCDKDNNMANGVQSCDEVRGSVITQPAFPCDKDNNMANGIQACGDEVLPDLAENPATPDNDVLGIRLSRAPALAAAIAPAVAAAAVQAAPAVQGAVLPFTGGDVMILLAVALGLIVAGSGALKLRRNES